MKKMIEDDVVLVDESRAGVNRKLELWRCTVVGFLGYPQPGGGAHPPIPSEGGLGEVLWRLG